MFVNFNHITNLFITSLDGGCYCDPETSVGNYYHNMILDNPYCMKFRVMFNEPIYLN